MQRCVSLNLVQQQVVYTHYPVLTLKTCPLCNINCFRKVGKMWFSLNNSGMLTGETK